MAVVSSEEHTSAVASTATSPSLINIDQSINKTSRAAPCTKQVPCEMRKRSQYRHAQPVGAAECRDILRPHGAAGHGMDVRIQYVLA